MPAHADVRGWCPTCRCEKVMGGTGLGLCPQCDVNAPRGEPLWPFGYVEWVKGMGWPGTVEGVGGESDSP